MDHLERTFAHRDVAVDQRDDTGPSAPTEAHEVQLGGDGAVEPDLSSDFVWDAEIRHEDVSLP